MPPTVPRVLSLVSALPLAAQLLLAFPAPVGAASAWQTWIRIRDYADLLAEDDAVWCAAADAGLFRLQPSSGRFDSFQSGPGSVTSNQLTSLAKDRQGRLWVASRGRGVSRLTADEERWEVVNAFDGLPGDTVNVLEAIGDTVWIGTSTGIALWNGIEIAGSLPDQNTVSFDATFPSISITGVAVLGDTVWLATQQGLGWARLSTGLTDWRPANQGLSELRISRLASDGRWLLVQVADGVFSYDFASARWVYTGLNRVHDLTDDRGSVLASSEHGLFRWTGSGWELIPGAPSPTNVEPHMPAALGPSGTIFIARPDTVYQQPASAGAWKRYESPQGPPGINLTGVAVEGTKVYVTTYDSGVGRYDGARWRYWPFSPCVSGCDTTMLSAGFTFALLVDKQGRKWVGSWGTAIEVLHDTGAPSQCTHHFVGDNTADDKHTWAKLAALDSSGGHWFGMDTRNKGIPGFEPIGIEHYDAAGAYVANYQTSNSTVSGNLVSAMTVSKNGRLWIGWDGQGCDFVTLPVAAPDRFQRLAGTNGLVVRGLTAYGDSLWLLTPTQLRRYSASFLTPQVTYSIPVGQANFGTQVMDVGRDGTVWLGTIDGIYGFHPSGILDHFDVDNSPLASDEVRAVDVDPVSGAVWIASAEGLNRYDPGFVPEGTSLSRLSVKVFPNPATLANVGTGIRLSGDGVSYRGEVMDLAGRRVKTFAIPANGRVFWDGRDGDGVLVMPGVYFVRVEAGGREAFARVVLLR